MNEGRVIEFYVEFAKKKLAIFNDFFNWENEGFLTYFRNSKLIS